jgi:hypothetical protein
MFGTALIGIMRALFKVLKAIKVIPVIQDHKDLLVIQDHKDSPVNKDHKEFREYRALKVILAILDYKAKLDLRAI